MTNSTDVKVVGALLALAISIGGAGVSFPRLQMLLQICALAAAAYLLVTPRDWRLPQLSLLAVAVLACILLLPLLQLVPLPPALWTQFPGRALPAEVDAALGWSRWRPLSLDVEATIRSFLALLAPAVIFIGCLFVPRNERARLLWVVLAFALISALMGIAQLTTAGSLTPYSSGHLGYPVGLFVNRNHQAALLLVAIPLAAAAFASQDRRGRSPAAWAVASLSAMIVCAIVILGTTSRMGLIVLPLAVAGSLPLLLRRQLALRSKVMVVLAFGAVATLLLSSGRFDRITGRFSGFTDSRFDFWTDIQWALDHYGLAGTGFGTFVPVHQSAESLEAVVPQVINHAHNDYLEILLEGGIPAVFVFLLFITIFAVALLRSFNAKRHAEQSAAVFVAALGIVILLAASLVDYPLRMPALSAVFALLCAILLPSKRPAPSTSTDIVVPSSRRRPMRLGALPGVAVLATLLVVAAQAGMSAYYLSNGSEGAALRWASWSTQAHERGATKALLRNDLRAALSHGQAAIALSPISGPAIRTLGLAHLANGATASGNRLMQAAVILGWRDPLTQLWAIEATKLSREPEKAIQRAEALFRQNTLVSAAIAQLLRSPTERDIVRRLAEALARRPAWRREFFEASGELPAATAGAWLELVELLSRTAAPVSAAEAEPSLDALLAAGRADEARRLWERLHGADQLVSNGGFEAIDPRRGATFPTDWYVPQRNRSLVKVERPDFGPGDRALHIRSTQDPAIIRQRLMLRPGAYTLTYRARGSAASGTALQWELRCGARGVRQTVDANIVPSADWQKISATIIVPNQDCPIQRLEFRRSGATPVDDAWLDEIQLRKGAR